MRTHEKSPGGLYDSAIAEMAKTLGARGGATNPEAARLWAPYSTSVVQGTAKPEDLPAERLQEMRTLCEALTHAGTGKNKQLVDLLVTRFMSLEAKATGQRELSRGLEIVDTRRKGLATPGQLRAATKALRDEAKLKAAADRLRSGR